MIRTTPAVLLAAALAAPALAQVVVGPVLNPANGHRYYRLAANDWAGARAQAAAMGATLVTINDAATNAWVRANIAAAGGSGAACFIGLSDAAAEGTFRWLGGDPVTYTSWGAGEPNNQGDEDAVSMLAATGAWNDVPTTGVFIPAIVEIDGPIHVPAEYPSIQAAIDAAVEGQTILVAPGVYTGSFDLGFKNLVIASEAGADATTILTTDGASGIVIAGGQTPATVLEGFTIRPLNYAYRLFFLDSRCTIRGCRIGGAAAFGILSWGSPTISDCLLVGNGFSGLAAEAAYKDCSVVVQNCTAVGNSSSGLIASGPHAEWSASLKITNSIVYGNGSGLALIGVSTARVLRSNIQGGAAGAGNFSADPAFASAPGADGVYDLADDYAPGAGSPCLDAADPSLRIATAAVIVSTDAAGRTRVIDDPSVPGALDIGAFESQGSSCLTDFNHDGFVDFFDYDDFVAAFEGGC